VGRELPSLGVSHCLKAGGVSLIRRRLWWLAVGLLSLFVLTLSGLFWAQRHFSQPPSREAVQGIWFGEETVAYEVRGGTPHVLVRQITEGSDISRRLVLDHLKLDWISISWPPSPAWQLTGSWASISRTADPASVKWSVTTGGQEHDDLELFGEITDASVVAMEVDCGGERHRFDVAAPGYIVWFDCDKERPSRYRWLDAAGSVVWELGGDG
jgi:hypothetical protein